MYLHEDRELNVFLQEEHHFQRDFMCRIDFPRMLILLFPNT